jgi:hypothetical protein
MMPATNVPTQGGAFGFGELLGFIVFPILLVWLGRRAIIRGLAAHRLSRAPTS